MRVAIISGGAMLRKAASAALKGPRVVGEGVVDMIIGRMAGRTAGMGD
jgi:hypothetical protein